MSPGLVQKCVELLSTVYQLVVKPSVFFLFKLFYRTFFWQFSFNKIRQVEDDVLLLSASTLAKKIRDRSIKSEYVVKAYVSRIKELQPVLNIVCDERFEAAIKEARTIDGLIESDLLSDEQREAPLLGVPFTCKELIGVQGLNFSAGQVLRKNVKADRDARVVELMRNAGAIPLCVTVTSELGFWFESSNYVYGTSRNPYDGNRMIGGSSGGEGCLISACGSLIGVGSDIGGSIRMPAVFNGIFGHKPSNGLVSNDGVYPPLTANQNFMCTNGPLTRYAQDLDLVLDILLDQNKSKLVNYDNFDLNETEFYFIDHLDAPFVSKMSKDVQAKHYQFVKYIESKFRTRVVRLNGNDFFDKAFEMWFTMITNGDSNQVCQLISVSNYEINPNKKTTTGVSLKNPLVEMVKSIFGKSEHTLPTLALALLEKLPVNSNAEEISEFMQLLETTRAKLSKLLGTKGVLIFPSFPSTAPYHNQALFTNPLDWIVYFGIMNSLGLPSTNIPLGLSNVDGLPIGVQLVANRYCDKLTISLAKYLEDQNEMVRWIQPGRSN